MPASATGVFGPSLYIFPETPVFESNPGRLPHVFPLCLPVLSALGFFLAQNGMGLDYTAQQ